MAPTEPWQSSVLNGKTLSPINKTRRMNDSHSLTPTVEQHQLTNTAVSAPLPNILLIQPDTTKQIFTSLLHAYLVNQRTPATFQTTVNKTLQANGLPSIVIPETLDSTKIINLTNIFKEGAEVVEMADATQGDKINNQPSPTTADEREAAAPSPCTTTTSHAKSASPADTITTITTTTFPAPCTSLAPAPTPTPIIATQKQADSAPLDLPKQPKT